MGGRQRFRPFYGRTFRHLKDDDEVVDGIIIGSGYQLPRKGFGNNPLHMIMVVEDPRAVQGFMYLSGYDLQTFEDAVLRNRLAIDHDSFEAQEGYAPYLCFAKMTVKENFLSPEYCQGIHERFKQLGQEMAHKEKKKERPQMKASTIFNRVKDDTVRSAKAAGKLEFVGRTGLAVAKQELGAVLPMIPKEFLDHPGSDVAVSMVVLTLIAAFAPDNKYAGVAAEAMSTVAFQNAMGQFKIPELAGKLVSEIGVEKIKALMNEDQKDQEDQKD